MTDQNKQQEMPFEQSSKGILYDRILKAINAFLRHNGTPHGVADKLLGIREAVTHIKKETGLYDSARLPYPDASHRFRAKRLRGMELWHYALWMLCFATKQFAEEKPPTKMVHDRVFDLMMVVEVDHDRLVLTGSDDKGYVLKKVR